MAYRSTPLENGYSPSELLFGRKIKTTAPVLPANLLRCWPQMSKFPQKDNDIKEKQKHYFDQLHRVKQLPELSQGQAVWIPDRKENGEKVDKHMTPRSYVVKTPDNYSASKSQTSHSIVITSQGKQCKERINTTSSTNPEASSIK